jgi:hypothetical protein
MMGIKNKEDDTNQNAIVGISSDQLYVVDGKNDKKTI